MKLGALTDPPDTVGFVYMNGTLLLVAGLAIVRLHNRWVSGWPVLGTLIGWLFTLGGLSRMLFPQSTQSGDTWVYAMCVALAAIGIVLTFEAYWPRATNLMEPRTKVKKGRDERENTL